MSLSLNAEQQADLIKRGYSRRSFGKIASLIAAAGASVPLFNEPAMAQLSMVKSMPADAVKINANENPMGPCPEAAEAIYGVVKKGGRYMYEDTIELATTLGEQEGLKVGSGGFGRDGELEIFAGSSAPLQQAVIAFCSKDKCLVRADPGYEQGARAAEFVGAKVVNVPLKKGTWDHDVKAMVEQGGPNVGLFYVCNPNNPTGTITKKSDIEWLVANKPAGSIVMIDEAYIHFSKDAEKCSDMVAAGKDVIILRTFSKLYGMAGLRAGAAFARPDLLEKMRPYSAGAMPITSMVGANSSLKVKTLVADRRKTMTDIREDVFSYLTAKNVEFIPSQSNCFMLNAKVDGKQFYKAMADEKVYIGRVWPVWPTWVRITVGDKDDMKTFKKAFDKVYA